MGEPGGHFFATSFAKAQNGTRQPAGEYPRPQLQRQRWLSLDGWWEWQELRNRRTAALGRGAPLRHSVLVPYPVESALSGLGLGDAAAGLRHMRYRR